MRKRGGRNNVVGIVIKPWAGCPRNLGSISGRDKKLFLFYKVFRPAQDTIKPFVFSG
jgi:hypothetical protein